MTGGDGGGGNVKKTAKEDGHGEQKETATGKNKRRRPWGEQKTTATGENKGRRPRGRAKEDGHEEAQKNTTAVARGGGKEGGGGKGGKMEASEQGGVETILPNTRQPHCVHLHILATVVTTTTASPSQSRGTVPDTHHASARLRRPMMRQKPYAPLDFCGWHL